MGLALILYVLLVALVGTNGHKLSARDTNDYIKDLKRGVLVKNGKLTSCELLPIDSRAAVVAASCLGYTKESIIDKDDIYTVYYDKGRDNIEGQYKVDNISVHSNFNPSNYVNDLAILQFNSDSKETWQSRLASYGGYEWDSLSKHNPPSDEFITEVRYDPDYKMIDHDFDNDIAATNVGGDFFKDQKDATNPSLATDSSSLDSLSSDLSTGFGNSDTDGESDDSPTSNDNGLGADKEDGNHGLTQREKAIIAACVSVGGAIVIGLILLIVWWRRWRDRDVADPMEQTLYQDAIENEIGGVSVPAYSPNSHVLRNDSASELTADVFSPLPRGSDQVPNSVNIFRADLLPTYEDVAERRMDPLLTTTEKNDLKRDEE
ncbi:hypothetical protein IW141_001424 [Coemansia sp. RSA 355]|nr:hypothetical protein IW141_001424 [Coemansia sp. RSA 355]